MASNQRRAPDQDYPTLAGRRFFGRDTVRIARTTSKDLSFHLMNQAQAHLERNGTFVFLSSETLNSDQLATLAAGLKPASPTASFE